MFLKINTPNYHKIQRNFKSILHQTHSLLPLCLISFTGLTSCKLFPLSKTQEKTELDKAYDTFRASLGIITQEGVHRDYIHQVVYFRDLLNAMNDSIEATEQLNTIKIIADQLTAVTTQGSVAQSWIGTTIEFQGNYYLLPTKESPEVLGRKAVATAIYLQYLSPLLDKTNTNLKKFKLGDIVNFNDINTAGFDTIKQLTIAYYAQASKVDQIEMNLGFDYEKTFIIRFSEDLDEFYKK
ncbi:MAG: hypothetical protein P8I61_06580 [Opitutae bacterium]|nr:hypothetical protein [Opitutae bacterium]